MIRIQLGKIGFGNQIFIYCASLKISDSGIDTIVITNLERESSILELQTNAREKLNFSSLERYSYLNLYLYLLSRYPRKRKVLSKIFKVVQSEEINPTKFQSKIKRYQIAEGYFQNLLWLTDVKDEIRNASEKKIKSDSLSRFKPSGSDRILGLHIRRGDYLNYKTSFGVLSIDYYKKSCAILDLEEYDEIYIFSDDIAWCRQQFTFLPNAEYIGEEEIASVQETHFLMGQCNTLICGNSTFSITAAYVYEVENVIVPKQLYFDGSIVEELTASYPNNWKKIEPYWDFSQS
jgi:hypothetical protein